MTDTLETMDYEALFFDFDDCLLDTKRDRAWTTMITLHENGYPEATLEMALEYLGGDTVSRFMATAGISDVREGERLGKLWDQVNLREGYPTAEPFPGVKETLDSLRERYPMAIFSASLTPVIRGALERNQMLEWFEEVLGKDKVPELKPSPLGLEILCTRLGVHPARCLYVGDTPVDIQAGKAAGMRTVAVTWGFGSRTDLERESPDFILDRFEDLERFVEDGR